MFVCSCFFLQEHVALWGGRHVEVYALSRDKGVVRQAGRLVTKEWSLALSIIVASALWLSIADCMVI